MTNDVVQGQCAVKENAKAFDRGREWECNIINLKLNLKVVDLSFKVMTVLVWY